MASGGSKRVLRVAKETQPYRTELTPVSFLRRSAYVFPERIAVVHGARRYTYRQFEERANRLASGLRALGLRHLDRVAAILPNIPAMLDAHYGVPAAGLVLVPVNTRLSRDEIGYILKHSGARVLFVDQEFEPLVEAARPARRHGDPRRRHRRRPAIPTRTSWPRSSPEPCEPWIEDEYETISINYTSGTTGRPKGVMIHHRGAYLNALGEVLETGMTFDVDVSLDAADVPLQRLVLHVGRDGDGRHARLPAPRGAGPDLGPDRRRGRHPLLRRAHRADRHRQRSQGARAHAAGHVRGRGRAALADAARPPEGARLPARPRLRPHRDVRAAHRLRLGHGMGRPAGRRDGAQGRAPGAGLRHGRPGARRRRAHARRPDGRRDAGRGHHARQQRHEGLLRAARGHRRGVPRRLVPLRRPGGVASRRLHRAARPQEGHHHLRRREHLDHRGRAGGRQAPGGAGMRGGRRPRRQVGRAAQGVRHAQARDARPPRRRSSSSAASTSPTSSARRRSSSATCRRRRPARSRSSCCATASGRVTPSASTDAAPP